MRGDRRPDVGMSVRETFIGDHGGTKVIDRFVEGAIVHVLFVG